MRQEETLLQIEANLQAERNRAEAQQNRAEAELQTQMNIEMQMAQLREDEEVPKATNTGGSPEEYTSQQGDEALTCKRDQVLQRLLQEWQERAQRGHR